MRGVAHLRAGNGTPELLGCGRRRGDDRRARVDDGVEVGALGLAVHSHGCATDLPETVAAREVVVLDVVDVEVLVRATDEEFRAKGGELEAEDALIEYTLVDGGEEEEVMVQAGNSGESETEEAVSGI